jgi:O-antigen/teichoic acid export membrane protein
MGLSIWFVVALDMNWQGRISANIIAIIIFAVISIVLLYKNGWLVLKYKFTYIKDAVKFGAPLLTTNMFSFVVSSFDRMIIAQVIGMSAVGIYSVGTQFGQIIGILITSLNLAYHPWFFNKLKTASEEVKSKIVLLSYGYMVALFILAIATSYFMPVIVKVFVGAKFHEAISVIFWIFLTQAFVGMETIMRSFIIYTERTRSFFAVDIFTSLFHLILCYLLVKENGIIGAAQALTVTWGVRFLLTWVVSNKVYPMPWLEFYKNLLKR